MKNSVKIAIIQHAPVFNNLGASMQKLEQLVLEAAKEGSELIVFGETWLSGYPAWIDYCSDAALWNHLPTKEVFAQMWTNSIAVDSNECMTISTLAKKHKVVIVIGVNEKTTTGPGNGTVYNSLLTFNQDGKLINHHRKLMPTYTEKLLYGIGDQKGLKSVDTPFGRLSGSICWEHWMPLTRQTLHNSGEHIHIAVWPCVHEMHQIASRHYAFEGRCFVIAAGQILRIKDFPKSLTIPKHLTLDENKMILNGGSCIIAPDGTYLLEPQFDQETILYHTIENISSLYGERMALDVTGHYNRSDIFNFNLKSS